MHVRPKEESMDELFQAILSMKTLEECRAFLEDLCTMTELLAMQQRLMVAKQLRAGMVYSQMRGIHRGQHSHHQPGEPGS